MQDFLASVEVLLSPSASHAARSAADVWLQKWRQSTIAWEQAYQVVRTVTSVEHGPARLVAAQTLRGKVLLDADQLNGQEPCALREALADLCTQVVREQPLHRAVLVQCATAIADNAWRSKDCDILPYVMNRWGSDGSCRAALLEVLVSLAEERTNPLLVGATPSADVASEIFDKGAVAVSSWLSALYGNDVSEDLQCAALRCSRSWLPWLPPPSNLWVQLAAQLLMHPSGAVREEAAHTLVEVLHVSDRWADTHGHVPEVVCESVAPLLQPFLSPPRSRTNFSPVPRVACEAAIGMLRRIAPAVCAEEDTWVQFVRALAMTAWQFPGCAAYFFNALAIEMSECRRGGGGTGQAGNAVFAELLCVAAAALECGDHEDPDDDLIDLCFVVARGLGAEQAVEVLHRSEHGVGKGRTWALGAVLPVEATAAPNDGVVCAGWQRWVWSELERAVASPGAAEAWLLRRAGKWLARAPTAVPAVVTSMLHAGRDREVHAIVVDMGPTSVAASLVPMLVSASAGRPLICSAAVIAARGLGEDDFKSAMDMLTQKIALAPGTDAKDALRGMAAIAAELRGVGRNPSLRSASTEAFNAFAVTAWAALLEPQNISMAAVGSSATADAALEVLAIVLIKGHTALPSGNLEGVCEALMHGFARQVGPVAADAVALLLREFTDDDKEVHVLTAAVQKIAADGLEIGWDAVGAQCKETGAGHLSAAWNLVERAGRRLPRGTMRALCVEAHWAACTALASSHPVLAAPAIGLLTHWMESAGGQEADAPSVQRTWEACLSAMQVVPFPALQDELPSFLEALRDSCGAPPRGLDVMVREAFHGCAPESCLQAAADRILNGHDEQHIGSAVSELVHFARRRAVQCLSYCQ